MSNTLNALASLEVVKQAFGDNGKRGNGKPVMLNSDRGSQLTCLAYLDLLKQEGIKINGWLRTCMRQHVY